MGTCHIMMLLATTVCLFTEVTLLAANSTVLREPTKNESLGSVRTGLKDVHIFQNNQANYVEAKTSKGPAFISNSADPMNTRKLPSQNSTIYIKKDMFVKNKSSANSLSETKNNSVLPSNITNISAPKILVSDIRTHQRKRDHQREPRISKYVSSKSDENDDAMTISKTSVDEQGVRLKHDRIDGRNNTLANRTVTVLAPYDAKGESYQHGKRVGIRYPKCSCDNSTCDYSYCDLTSVPPDLNPYVTELLLNDNHISILLANGFSRYRFLERLDISNNGINFLEVGAFNGLSGLMFLNISCNSIGLYADLPDGIFEPLTSLKILRLYANNFPCHVSPPFQDRFLAYLHNLEELHTDNYGNSEYGPGFQNMTSLRNLSLYCSCTIDNLSNTSFRYLEQIKLLDISGCNIHGIHIDIGAFVHLTNLTILNISENKVIGMEYLPMILRGLIKSNLEVLLMDHIVSDFSVNFINSSITQYLPRTLTTLSARENNILSIDRDGFLQLPKSLKFIDLSENVLMVQVLNFPLEIMAELEVLLANTNLKECLADDLDVPDLPTRSESDVHQRITNSHRHARENRNVKRFQLQGLKIPRKLKRIQVNVKSMHETFLLYLDNRNSLEEIDLRCSVIPDFNFLGMINFPKLRHLNLGRSSIHNLSFPAQVEIPPIKFLILESNMLNNFLETSEAPFRRLSNLSYLDLSLNQIKNLQIGLFKGLDNVEGIRLDGNTFSNFGAHISNLGQLKLLNLSRTGLSYLPSQVRSHIDHLCQARNVEITIDMSDCPIQCDCFNLDFLKWMVSSPAFDKNLTGYKCRYSDTSVRYILDGYQETIRNLDRECAKNYPMFLVILAATMVLLCVVTGTIIYRFRWKIRYLYYAAYIKVMDTNQKAKKHEFKYDGFIAYDSEDQRFVTRHLAPELENRGLKLLIHTRDFVAGTYIASNIVMAVAESRKTLVVLTRNLIDSTWCNYEVQMATMEAVHTGRQVLMFLLKENIPNRELDVELLRHIKSNTYLPYPSPEEEGDEEIMKRFYDKLAHDLKC